MNAATHAWYEAHHAAFDGLLAAYLIHHHGSLPSAISVMELMEWSAGQLRQPIDEPAVCPCGREISTQTPAEATRHREIAEIQRCPSCGRLWFIGWDYEIVKACEIVKAKA